MTSGHDNWYQSGCFSPGKNYYEEMEMRRRKENMQWLNMIKAQSTPPPFDYSPYPSIFPVVCFDYYEPPPPSSYYQQPPHAYYSNPYIPSSPQPYYSDPYEAQPHDLQHFSDLYTPSSPQTHFSSSYTHNSLDVESIVAVEDNHCLIKVEDEEKEKYSPVNESDLDFDVNSVNKTPHLDVYDFEDFDVEIRFHKEVKMDVKPITLPPPPSRLTLSIDANKKSAGTLVLSKQYKEIPLEITVIQLNNNSHGPKLEDKFHLKRVGMSCPRNYVKVKIKECRRLKNNAITA